MCQETEQIVLGDRAEDLRPDKRGLGTEIIAIEG